MVLRLLTRRARVQFPLLAAVVAVVTMGATLLGVCALLLTKSQERALSEGMVRAAAPDLEATAYLAGIRAANAGSVLADTQAVMTQTLAPFRTTNAARVSSTLRPLGDRTAKPRRLAYLSGVDGLKNRAQLTTGRWPQSSGRSGPPEAVVLETTARQLDLSPGSRVRLGAEIPVVDGADAVTVIIVGVFRTLPGAGWDRDPLGGTGYDPAYLDGYPDPAQVYGPFVVAMSDLFASGSTIDRLQVTATPHLKAPTSATLDAVATSVAGANARLTKVLGDRVEFERVASDLPLTLALARTQQAVTRSTVLVVVLLGSALTAAALGLAGRLVDALRASETALLSALGTSRRQLIVVTAAEAALLAAIAALLAVPLSGLAHSALTHVPVLVEAGLAARPAVTSAQVAAVVLGAMLLAGVLVVPALRRDPEPAVVPRGRLDFLARSGADLLLLALAAVGWWQIRAQPATETGPDAVRVLAPVLCLLAGAALAPRLVMLPLRAAERMARRSRGVVLALAAFEAARRPRAVAAGLLLALAAATGTFGLAFGATWQRSQQDQADARVGTDLALSLTTPSTAGQGSSVAAATGGTLSPVTDRGVVVGRYIGTGGAAPRLVAVDTTRAEALLRGRLPRGTTWSQVGAALTPGTPISGVALPAGIDRGLTISGTSTLGSRLRVIPRLVFQDRAGLRTPCDAAAVALDGRTHPLRLCGPSSEELRVVAISLQINVDPTAPGATATGQSRLTVSVTLPTAGPAAAAGASVWAVTSAGSDSGSVGKTSAEARSTPTSTIVRTTATVNLGKLRASQPVQVVATGFQPPAAVPVAVSRGLADALRASVGGKLTVTVGGVPVPMVVARLVPRIPSAPGEVAMLADVDVLSRALISAGALEPAVDAWWAGRPTQPGAAAAAALGLGRVDTRAEVAQQLRSGPLRVGLPAALTLLVPAAVLLALAGTIMHVTSEVQTRALEVARLAGLGLRRRSILGALLAQHGAVLALHVGVGSAVGALVSWALGPLLIRSDLGARPVPTAAAQWPWLAETCLISGILVGGITTVGLVIGVQLRRANAAHLRAGA